MSKHTPSVCEPLCAGDERANVMHCNAIWKLTWTSNGFGAMVQRTHRAHDCNGRTLFMQHTLASSDWHRLHLIRVPNVATQSVAKDDIEVMTIGCKQICDLSSKSKWKRFRCSMRVDVDRDASMAIVNQMGSSVTIFFIFPTHICISHAHALARATKN